MAEKDWAQEAVGEAGPLSPSWQSAGTHREEELSSLPLLATDTEPLSEPPYNCYRWIHHHTN